MGFRNSTAKLLTYGSEEPIKLCGQLSTTLKVNGKFIHDVVYVINKENVNHVYKEIADIIICEYEEVFQVTGKLKKKRLENWRR